ncbi:MAG: FtsX-like permease family protein [Blastocatellia bacterium]|nr:FtsX-like permease family protein [Blastocatellia bacterium]
MNLAWRNLSHDRLRFFVTISGIAFAVFLMIFQGSLLTGFIRTSSIVIDATEADIWITARGVPSFDYGTALPRRFREMAYGVPGVVSVERVVSGYAVWQKPSGKRQVILLVGAEPRVGKRFPLPRLGDRAEVTQPECVVIDRSVAALFEVAAVPLEIEISQRHARVSELVDGFGTFLGNPYVFTNYDDAVRYLGLGLEETRFLLVRVAPNENVLAVQRSLGERLPEADVWTREEFARRSQLFWVIQTGAGGAILVAGILGFIVGLVVVSQNIYATTMEHIEEFATLKALGASRGYIQRIVLLQALVSGVIGSLIGMLAAYPAVEAIRGYISWIHTPWWLPAGMIATGLLMCGLASMVSIRKAVAVEPARVFRA